MNIDEAVSPFDMFVWLNGDLAPALMEMLSHAHNKYTQTWAYGVNSGIYFLLDHMVNGTMTGDILRERLAAELKEFHRIRASRLPSWATRTAALGSGYSRRHSLNTCHRKSIDDMSEQVIRIVTQMGLSAWITDEVMPALCELEERNNDGHTAMWADGFVTGISVLVQHVSKQDMDGDALREVLEREHMSDLKRRRTLPGEGVSRP